MNHVDTTSQENEIIMERIIRSFYLSLYLGLKGEDTSYNYVSEEYRTIVEDIHKSVYTRACIIIYRRFKEEKCQQILNDLPVFIYLTTKEYVEDCIKKGEDYSTIIKNMESYIIRATKNHLLQLLNEGTITIDDYLDEVIEELTKIYNKEEIMFLFIGSLYEISGFNGNSKEYIKESKKDICEI